MDNLPHSIMDELINLADIGLCICKMDGTVLFINQNGINLLGLNETNSITGNNITVHIQGFKKIIDKGRLEKIVKNEELSFKTGNDTIKWILCHCYAADDGNDEQRNLYIIFFDITSQKDFELRLQRSEKKLSSIIDTISDIVYRVDPKGIITFISDEVRQYGYEPNELIGKNILELVHPEDREKALYRMNERRTGNRKTKYFEVRLLTKNKEIVTFQVIDSEVNDSCLFAVNAEGIYLNQDKEDKIFIGTQGIARDVSRNVKIENVLQQSKEKWISIIETLEDGYYEVDLIGNLIYVNKALCSISGYKYEEIIGKSYRDFIASDESDNIYEIFNVVYKTGKPARLSEWVVIRQDGKKKYLEGSVSLIKDINENSIGFRGIIRDITEKYKMEQELLRARKMEAIGILAGGIAHDYNNALTAILGNISLAKMEVNPENSDLMEVLSDAEIASLKVMELTKRLSIFARGGSPERKITSIIDILRDALESVFIGTPHRYELSVPVDLWQIEVDEVQISHVMEHILINAKEAMSENGKVNITIENVIVEKEESHHEISLQPDNYVLVSIRDEGVGIKSEDIYKIFDPYYTTKDVASGMGLAISYAIIKRHHGYIDVKSEVGKGTTFYVYFPVAN